jgi:hypothetical protein
MVKIQWLSARQEPRSPKIQSLQLAALHNRLPTGPNHLQYTRIGSTRAVARQVGRRKRYKSHGQFATRLARERRSGLGRPMGEPAYV